MLIPMLWCWFTYHNSILALLCFWSYEAGCFCVLFKIFMHTVDVLVYLRLNDCKRTLFSFAIVAYTYLKHICMFVGLAFFITYLFFFYFLTRTITVVRLSDTLISIMMQKLKTNKQTKTGNSLMLCIYFNIYINEI